MGDGGSVSSDNLSGVATGLDDRSVSMRAREAEVKRLTPLIAEAAAVRAVAEYDLVILLKELEAAGGTEGWRSLRQWASWHTGATAADAKRLADVADVLDDLPVLAGAMAEGRIGLSAMAALATVATSENDESLAGLAATATGPQIEKICRDRRTQPDQPDPEAFISTRADRGGTAFRGWVPDEDGAELDSATDQMLGQLFDRFNAAKRGGDGDSAVPEDAQGVLDEDAPRPSKVDAFMEIVRHFLANPDAPTSGGGADRHLIHLHLSADGATFGDGNLADRATVERFLCDAGMVGIVSINGVPIWATEKQRAPSTALRRALRARDRCCQYPGCGANGYLEAHHVIHDEHGGETSLENLALICAFHHRFLHRTKRNLFRDPATREWRVRTTAGETEDGTKPWKPPGSRPKPVPGIRFPQSGPDILTHWARSVWNEHLNRIDETGRAAT